MTDASFEKAGLDFHPSELPAHSTPLLEIVG